MKTIKNLFIRADASASIGTGHVMRMLALAQAWQENGGEAVFLSAEITPALKTRLHGERFRLEEIVATPGSREDIAATCDLISGSIGQCTVALDGYQFDADYQLALKNSGCRLLVMDDYGHCAFYHADWVLNQNISAREELYAHRASYTQLLLGTSYALIRREFLQYRGWKRQVPEKASKVLVTLGGADSDNVTRKVMEALTPLDLEVKVVVGGSNPHLPKLRDTVAKGQNQPARTELIVNPADMPGLMAWADIAVAAGGSTAWELAFMGLPSLFVILAENQMEIARQLEAAGFGICLGAASELEPQKKFSQLMSYSNDYTQRKATSRTGRELVDGLGCYRMIGILHRNPEISLKPISMDDIEVLWEWANDPTTRKNSFNGEYIPWEVHRAWCHAKLNDRNCHLWIVTDSRDEMIACVRFDCSANEATISLMVAPAARGKGFGKKIISLACKRLFLESKIVLVKAYIKPDNTPSMKVFEGAGFVRQADTQSQGKLANYYELRAST